MNPERRVFSFLVPFETEIAGYSIMGYKSYEATRLQELGSAYNKDIIIEYMEIYPEENTMEYEYDNR